MKLFTQKICAFAILLITVCIGLDYLSMIDPWRMIFAKITNSEELISVNTGADEIIPFIEKVQSQDNTSTLIIGDSICHQMFRELQEYNDDICIAGTNAAISMTGQYILAEEYINNHPNATDIYLFVHPNSLCSSFDTKYGYQYTVMPFIETDTLKLLDQDTINNMASVYGRLFMFPKVVQLIEKSAINRKLYLNILANNKEGYIQSTKFEIADRYIRKIYNLCQNSNMKLHLYPCPVSDSKFENIKSMEKDYNNTWLYSHFPEYFEKILVYPDEQTSDGVHFSGKYASQDFYNEKISVIFAASELLDYLQMK